jgi:hypothetical protein
MLNLHSYPQYDVTVISPVRCHSHTTSLKGDHKGMQGFHSFLKTNVTWLRQTLEQMGSLEDMPDRVIVVLHAEMTDSQRTQILVNCHVRIDLCAIAIVYTRILILNLKI